MTENRFRKYYELEPDEKEVLDVFRQMKLMSDYQIQVILLQSGRLNQ